MQSDNNTQSAKITTTVGFKMDLRGRKVRTENNAGVKRNGNALLELSTRPKRQSIRPPDRHDFIYGKDLPKASNTPLRLNASAKVIKQLMKTNTTTSKMANIAESTPSACITRQPIQHARPKTSNNDGTIDDVKNASKNKGKSFICECILKYRMR